MELRGNFLKLLRIKHVFLDDRSKNSRIRKAARVI